MKVEFEVVRNGEVIFVTSAIADETDLPEITAHALVRFRKEFPALSLTDADIVLKWSEVEMLTN